MRGRPLIAWEGYAMGVDLKVMASHFRELRGEFPPTATLRFERDSGLFAQLSPGATPSLVRTLPPGMRVGLYEEQGLTFAEPDRYGQLLTFTTPADLSKLRVPDDLTPWNRAVLAFLLTLPYPFTGRGRQTCR
jgi:hypothetical protein